MYILKYLSATNKIHVLLYFHRSSNVTHISPNLSTWILNHLQALTPQRNSFITQWTGPLTTWFIQISWRADRGKIKSLIHRQRTTKLLMQAAVCWYRRYRRYCHRQRVVEKSCTLHGSSALPVHEQRAAGKEDGCVHAGVAYFTEPLVWGVCNSVGLCRLYSCSDIRT